MSREYTELLLQMVEEGMLDPDTVIMACVKYMSDDDVREMMGFILSSCSIMMKITNKPN